MDSSSIVKLYVIEYGTVETRDAMEAPGGLVTSVVAYAEVRSALARARRARRLQTDREFERQKQAFEADWPRYLQVVLTTELIRTAGDFAERHALSGFDAVHVATAASLAFSSLDEVKVSTWDKRLAAAAQAEGLSLAHEVT